MVKMLISAIITVSFLGCNFQQPAKEIQTTQGIEEDSSLKQAEALIAQGRIEEAVKLLERKIEKNPEDTRAYLFLAQVYMRLGALDNAIAIATESIRHDPHNGNAYLLMAGCYDLKGQRDRAIELIQIALAAYQEKQDAQGFQSALQVLQQLSPGNFVPRTPEEL